MRCTKRRRIVKELNDHALRRKTHAVRIIAAFLRSVSGPVNKVDPITMEPLGAHGPYFVLKETTTPHEAGAKTSTFVFEIYALQELVDKTGQLYNPITKRVFDSVQLRRLTRVARSKGHCFNIDAMEQFASAKNMGERPLADALLEHFVEVLDAAVYAHADDLPLDELAHIVSFIMRLNAEYYVDIFEAMDRYAFNSASEWFCDYEGPAATHNALGDLHVFLSLYNLVSQQVSHHLSPDQNADRTHREYRGKFGIIALCEAMTGAVQTELR